MTKKKQMRAMGIRKLNGSATANESEWRANREGLGQLLLFEGE
jgi:hypothetical protein